MIEVISITLVIIGALIGAGFASGQEIFLFLYIWKKWNIWYINNEYINWNIYI